MSVPMKKPLIKIEIDGKGYNISSRQKVALLTLVKEMSHEFENPFEELEKQLPKNAILLRGARKKESMSQEELSRKTGIAITNISKMENGERGVGPTVAKKLSKVLKISAKVFKKGS